MEQENEQAEQAERDGHWHWRIAQSGLTNLQDVGCCKSAACRCVSGINGELGKEDVVAGVRGWDAALLVPQPSRAAPAPVPAARHGPQCICGVVAWA